MNRKIFTDCCLPQRTLDVYPQIPIPITISLTSMNQMRKYVQEWYAIDDAEREHRMDYARRVNNRKY